MYHFTYGHCQKACYGMARVIESGKRKYKNVYGIPRGGCVPAVMMARSLDLPLVNEPTSPEETLIVDDVVDSGATLEEYVKGGYDTFCLVYKSKTSSNKPTYHIMDSQDWIVFDWESKTEKDPATQLIRYLEFFTDKENVLKVIEKLKI